MRLKCNKCNQWKNMKKSTYENMLKRFSIVKSIKIGITQPYMLLNAKKLERKLSDAEMEKEFLKWYQCKECRNSKPTIIQETKKLLNDFKQSKLEDEFE